MNHSTEKFLRQMSLVEPPDSLDQAILHAAQEDPQNPSSPRIRATHTGPSWWFTSVSAASCSLIGIAIGYLMAGGPPVSTVVDGWLSPRHTAVQLRESAVNHEMPTQHFMGESRAVDDTAPGPTNLHPSATELSDQGLYLLNGARPVRKYRARTWRQVRSWDTHSGSERSFQVPVWQIVLTPAPGV